MHTLEAKSPQVLRRTQQEAKENPGRTGQEAKETPGRTRQEAKETPGSTILTDVLSLSLPPSGRTSRAGREVEKEDRAARLAQEERMRRREEEERVRERELFLSGRARPSQEEVKRDRVLQIQAQLSKIEERSRRKTSSGERRASKVSTKSRWQEVVLKLHVTPRVDRQTTSDKEQEIVLVDKELEQESGPSERAFQEKLASNPVFQSFERARDVEDLYRIAEFWVNPQDLVLKESVT